MELYEEWHVVEHVPYMSPEAHAKVTKGQMPNVLSCIAGLFPVAEFFCLTPPLSPLEVSLLINSLTLFAAICVSNSLLQDTVL